MWVSVGEVLELSLHELLGLHRHIKVQRLLLYLRGQKLFFVLWIKKLKIGRNVIAWENIGIVEKFGFFLHEGNSSKRHAEL